MAVTEEISWGDGSGDKIYLTANALEGNQTVLVSSDANSGAARFKTITFSASGVTPVTLTVSQEASTSVIPYIRNTDVTSYIDTGITPSNNTRVIIWARNINPGVSNTSIFGARDSSSKAIFSLHLASGTGTGLFRIGYNTSTTNLSGDKFRYFSNYHKYELNGNSLYVDDTLIGSVTSGTFSGSSSIHLFGQHYESGHYSSGLPIDICACKIYKNNTLVRDFTPVRSPSAGLYDAVSNTVFTKSAGGDFVYGTFDPDAYVPLEYITANEAQHFDSGIKGSNSLAACCKFSANGSVSWPCLFGAQTTGSSKRYEVTFGNSSSPYTRIYFAYNTTSKNVVTTIKNTDLVVTKNANKFYLYKNNSQVTVQTFTAATFTTDYNLYVAAINNAGSASQRCGGKIYYLGFGTNRNFVPAKVNDVAGMYDTYNDVFYPSATSTPFVAGPEL